jgi:hypothetical protein
MFLVDSGIKEVNGILRPIQRDAYARDEVVEETLVVQ